MSEFVSPEVNNNFREDTLPKRTPEYFDQTGTDTEPKRVTADVVVLGEDTLTTHMPEDFIGPRDATNEARPFLEIRARDLATIAVMNMGAYGREYMRVVDATRESIDAGMLRLGSEFPNATLDQQIHGFVSSTMEGARKPDAEVVSGLKAQIRLASKGPDREAQLELDAARETIAMQSQRILAVRSMLVERGAADEFLRDFDYTTKLMTKPDQEVYEHEKELSPELEVAPLVNTDEVRMHQNFLDVLRVSFSKRALKRVGIVAPNTADVEIIAQQATSRS